MEVILLESFDRLGKIGDVVKVKNGFARNFLIPYNKALRANKENKEYFAKIKSDLIEKNDKVIAEAKNVLRNIADKEIIFIRNASENGQLYGSVSPRDISNYFKEKKIDIKPSNINLHSAIKKIGIFEINIKLHADVICNLKLNVATSKENAKFQQEEEKVKKNISISKEKNTKKHEKEKKDLSPKVISNQKTTNENTEELKKIKNKEPNISKDNAKVDKTKSKPKEELSKKNYS